MENIKDSNSIFRGSAKITKQEHNILDELCKQLEILNQARSIVRQFWQMMLRDRNSNGLNEWISTVENSSIPELQGFANGLLRDFEPVKNAFDYPWSYGPV